jgi:hydroxymethylpyrimidine pyrophosphatase-like HAD family hydrolase
MASNSSTTPRLYLATDLDRTLFPNGAQDEDDCMSDLKEAIERHHLGLIYVTGRNQDQIREGMNTYDPPPPEYAIAEVGTRIHTIDPDCGAFQEMSRYTRHLHQVSPTWNRKDIQDRLMQDTRLRLQAPHNQNPFKISFHCEPVDLDALQQDIPGHLSGLTTDVQVICSVDETTDEGLVDILPGNANKLHALEFLKEELNLTTEQIIYAGDSGNDLQPLASGFRSILVANATDSVRQAVLELSAQLGTHDSLYLAKPADGLNGCYYSGILLGLRHYGIID